MIIEAAWSVRPVRPVRPRRPVRPGRRERGLTLVEALVACLVLSLGLLAMSRVQGQLRLTADTARQRSEAVRLAQEDIEQLRAFSSIGEPGAASGSASAATPGATRSYADIVTATRVIGASTGYTSNTLYTLSRQVDTSNVASAKNVSVTVSWPDRAGKAQRVVLASIIAANDPGLTGALGVAPVAAPVVGPLARSIHIPLTAIGLGNGTSMFRPAGGSMAFVFDDDSGVITSRCTLAATSADITSPIAATDLKDCVKTTAYLLSGTLRFSSSTGADVSQANDVPLAAAVGLKLGGGTYPRTAECSDEAVITVAVDRYLSYACVIYPRADGRWSGQTTVEPAGWSFGPGASAHRVCRYANSASNASAGVDTSVGSLGNLGSYIDQPGSLANQNFVVLRGDQACPG